MLYDLIVLGGGPAGYLGAERAAQAGMQVLLFEARNLGGTCLNEGCIPTKTMLNSAKLYAHAREGQPFGVQADNVSVDHAAVVARSEKVVATLVGGVGMTMKKCKVTVNRNTARITGKTAEGFTVEAAGETFTAKKLLISTGSEAVVPPIPGVRDGLDRGYVMTNREILKMTQLPQTLVVIGGGVIGLEMAAYFNAVGVKVLVIEMLDKIAGPCDADIAKQLQKELKKQGVTFCLGCRVTAVEEGKVSYETKDGTPVTVEADKVLLSIGRRANSAGIGLETIGVHTERGAIVTDAHLRTNIDGVYASGDVNGRVMLAHVAYRESEVAVHDMQGVADEMRYDAIPSVIYTMPEAAWVGMTEQQARDAGLEIRTVKTPMAYSGRFVAENDKGSGVCKLVVSADGRLLGVHLLGTYASEIIWGAVPLVEQQLPVEEIKRNVFPHPTVAEIIREALFQL